MSNTTQIVFIIFTAIMLVSVLIELGAILAILLAARKTEKKVMALAAEFREHVMPSVNSSRATVEDLSPKVKAIASNLVETSHSVREMADEVSRVVADVAVRTRVQAANVDEMIQGTLDQVTRAGNTLQHGFAIPLRQATGILNGLRAGFQVMCDKAPADSTGASRGASGDGVR